jgi:hypothetical protein
MLRCDDALARAEGDLDLALRDAPHHTMPYRLGTS